MTIIPPVGSPSFAVSLPNSWRVNLFGYYAWAIEVGRNPKGDMLRDDSQTWLDFTVASHVMNVILKEIDDISVNSSVRRTDRIRVKGECHFIRASLFHPGQFVMGKHITKATSATPD